MCVFLFKSLLKDYVYMTKFGVMLLPIWNMFLMFFYLIIFPGYGSYRHVTVLRHFWGGGSNIWGGEKIQRHIVYTWNVRWHGLQNRYFSLFKQGRHRYKKEQYQKNNNFQYFAHTRENFHFFFLGGAIPVVIKLFFGIHLEKKNVLDKNIGTCFD